MILPPMVKFIGVFTVLCAIQQQGANSQQSIQVTSVLTSPFLMENENELHGFCKDLMDELRTRMGVNMNLRIVKDGSYGAKTAYGNWSGMIGEVLSGDADIAIAPLTISANRIEVVDFSQPFLSTGISAIVRKPAPVTDRNWLTILKVYQVQIWLLIGFAWLLVTGVLYGISRLNTAELSDHFSVRRNWHDVFWMTLSALTFQPSGLIARGLPTRILLVGWYCFCVLLLLSYVIGICSLDANRPPQQTYMDSLAAQNKVLYGIQKGGSTMQFFKENYAFLLEESAATYSTSRNCELTLIGPKLNQVDYGIAMRKNSPFKEKINSAIVALKQSGMMLRLTNRWWKDRAICSHLRDEQIKKENNSISVLSGAFNVLVLMVIVAVLAALVQFAIDRSRNKTNEPIAE